MGIANPRQPSTSTAAARDGTTLATK